MSVLDVAGHLGGSQSPSARPEPTFLQGVVAMHDAMRRDSARLIHAVDRADVPARGAALRRWWALFQQVIEHHHDREDDVAWPELRRRDPEFAAAELVLLDDHHALDAAMARVARSLDTLAERDAIGRAAMIEASQAVVAFDRLLDDHLTREEETAFARIERVFSPADWAELEQQFIKGMSLRAFAFTLPWVLDGVDGPTTRSVLAAVPLPIRLLHRLVFRRSYRRVVAPLVAGPAVPTMRNGGSVSISVDATPEHIYAIISDITRTGEWSDECYRVVWTTPHHDVGARWKGWSRVGRIRWTRRGEIIEATPGRAFAYRTIPTLVKHDSTVWRFLIEPDGDACKLTQSYELTVLPYRLTERMIARSVPHHLDRRPDMLDTVARIKALAEATKPNGDAG